MTAAATPLRVVQAPSKAEQVPAHDLEAEGEVLATLIAWPGEIERVSAFLLPEHFFAERHRRIYEAILAERSDGHTVDVKLVAKRLRDQGRIEQVGGVLYLREILDACLALPGNVVSHAMTVHEKWRVRAIVAAAHRVTAEGYQPIEDVQAWADRATRSISDVAQRTVEGRTEPYADLILRVVRSRMSTRDEGPAAAKRTRGVSTGLDALDALTFGMHPGQKITLAGLPGTGKTSLACQIAMHVGGSGLGVLFFQGEITREEMADRHIANAARVDSQRFAAGRLTAAEWARVTAVVDRLMALSIDLDDTPDIDVDHIRARAIAEVDRRRVARLPPLGLVVVDHLHRLRPAKCVEHAKENVQLSHATHALKVLARDMGVPVLELAQQRSTEVDKVTKVRPKPGKGFWSGSKKIEEEADNSMYLHRNPLLHAVTGRVVGEDPSRITLIVAKQRGGEEGEVQLHFDRPCGRWECISDARGNEAPWASDSDTFTTEGM